MHHELLAGEFLLVTGAAEDTPALNTLITGGRIPDKEEIPFRFTLLASEHGLIPPEDYLHLILIIFRKEGIISCS